MGIEVTDPNDMIAETSSVLLDLEYAIDDPLGLDVMEYDDVLVCGMGGSAIGGDIFVDCMYALSDKVIKVVRFPELPIWADDRTLVLVSTYSGNTAETLSIYDQASKRGCRIIAISSGGKLEEKALQDGVPLVKVKSGMQPRNAVGCSLGYLFNIMASIGGPDIRAEVRKSLPSLKKYLSTLSPLDGVPRDIAGEIMGSLPVIYSSNALSAIAGRWRAQFNENSKLIAFDGHLPDTNHGDITGIVESTEIVVKPIILFEEPASKMLKNTVNATVSTLKSRGMRPYVVRISGKTVFEREMRAIMLGDFISLHLAFFNNIDPSDISSISALKKTLSKKMGRSGKILRSKR